MTCRLFVLFATCQCLLASWLGVPALAQQATSIGRIAVRVPADAIVTINGRPTRSAGAERTYFSRGLRSGVAYAYAIRVEHERNGSPTVWRKTIELRAGEVVALSFERRNSISDSRGGKRPSARDTPAAPETPPHDPAPETPPHEPAPEEPPRLPVARLIETARAKGSFTTMLRLAQEADVLEELDGVGPFTVFAPTDDAFQQFPAEILEALRADRKALREVLLYHALLGRFTEQEATRRGTSKSVLGPQVRFERSDGGGLMVNSARVVESDVNCTNGVLHAIDRVLLPPEFRVPDLR